MRVSDLLRGEIGSGVEASLGVQLNDHRQGLSYRFAPVATFLRPSVDPRIEPILTLVVSSNQRRDAQSSSAPGMALAPIKDMDLINDLSKQLGVDASKAQAIAGSAMSTIRGAVGNSEGEATAKELEKEVPEMKGWEQAAASLEGPSREGGGGLGSKIAGAVGSMMGGAGGQTAQLSSMLGKVGLDPTKLGVIGPLVLNFLQSRINPALMDKVTKAAPGLLGR